MRAAVRDAYTVNAAKPLDVPIGRKMDAMTVCCRP
jgi:hypothetical protein